MITLPKWIEGLQEHLGLDQTEFAKLIGVTQGTVSRWQREIKPQKPLYDSMDLLEETTMRAGYPTFRKPTLTPEMAELAEGLKAVPEAMARSFVAGWRAQVISAIGKPKIKGTK